MPVIFDVENYSNLQKLKNKYKRRLVCVGVYDFSVDLLTARIILKKIAANCFCGAAMSLKHATKWSIFKCSLIEVTSFMTSFLPSGSIIGQTAVSVLLKLRAVDNIQDLRLVSLVLRDTLLRRDSEV
jgi:hypothetical protein